MPVTGRIALIALWVALSAEPVHATPERAALPDGPAVQLSDVPAAAIAAARTELEAKPTGAKSVSFEGQPAYLIEATNRYDKHLGVVVSAAGKVLIPVNIWDADDD